MQDLYEWILYFVHVGDTFSLYKKSPAVIQEIISSGSCFRLHDGCIVKHTGNGFFGSCRLQSVTVWLQRALRHCGSYVILKEVPQSLICDWGVLHSSASFVGGWELCRTIWTRTRYPKSLWIWSVWGQRYPVIFLHVCDFLAE